MQKAYTFNTGNNPKRKTKSDIDDDDFEDDYSNTRSGLYVRKKTILDIDYFLDREITAPSDYRDLLHYLNNMQELDSLNIFVNSGGGRIDTTIQLLAGINGSEGDVTLIAAGMAASAASMLLLNANKVIVTPEAQMMIHTASYGTWGKTGEVASDVKFRESFIDKLIHQTYDGFLTETEIRDLKIGQDYYFDSKEIIARMTNRVKYKEEVEAKANEEVAKKAKKIKSK